MLKKLFHGRKQWILVFIRCMTLTDLVGKKPGHYLAYTGTSLLFRHNPIPSGMTVGKQNCLEGLNGS